MSQTTAPRVSVIMANYRGAAFIAEAIASIMRQTIDALELIVADDASDDASCEIVARLAHEDPRIRLIASHSNCGPAAARNRALDAARGEWIAIVDSDDLIHPHRLQRMIAAADRVGTDILADDLVPFGDAPGLAARTLFEGLAQEGATPISPADFVRSDLSADQGSLGYCKPIIRRSALGSLRYDEAIGIGEDFDFCLRLLMAGLRFVFWPEPTYLYRRHGTSLSHRLSIDHLQRQIAGHDRLLTRMQTTDPDLTAALDARRRALLRALSYEHVVAAIKARRFGEAAGRVLRSPSLTLNLARSLRERRQGRRAGEARRREPREIFLIVPDDPRPRTDPDRVLAVPPPPEREPATNHRPLACALADLYAAGPLDVTVEASAALYGLGYLPGADKITLRLPPGDETPDRSVLPEVEIAAAREG